MNSQPSFCYNVTLLCYITLCSYEFQPLWSTGSKTLKVFVFCLLEVKNKCYRILEFYQVIGGELGQIFL